MVQKTVSRARRGKGKASAPVIAAPAADPQKRKRGRPRAYDPDRALGAAMDVFWKDGFAGTSLDEVPRIEPIEIDSQAAEDMALRGEPIAHHRHGAQHRHRRKSCGVELDVGTHRGLMGTTMQDQFDLSYLADNIILMRYFEAQGRVRNALSIVKKRVGMHERTLREFTLGEAGIRIGGPLHEFEGVLTGTPTYIGKNGKETHPDSDE